MTEDQREIRRKKRVIEYAEKNGDIKTACRRFGIARSTFYLWRDRYRESGDEGLGLNSRPPGSKNPRTMRNDAYLQLLPCRWVQEPAQSCTEYGPAALYDPYTSTR